MEIRVPIVTSDVQDHVTQQNQAPAAKSTTRPAVGTLLYRYDGEDDEQTLVVVQTSVKRRGLNRGIIDLIICRPVIRLTGGEAIFNNQSSIYTFQLNNRGNWFNQEELKRYTYSWDVPIVKERGVQTERKDISDLDLPDFVSRSPSIQIGEEEVETRVTPLFTINRPSSWNSPSVSPTPLVTRERSLSQPAYEIGGRFQSTVPSSQSTVPGAGPSIYRLASERPLVIRFTGNDDAESGKI